MNFTYETRGTNTYLVYTVQPEDLIDTMSLGMLTNNRIPGLASTVFTQLDTVKYIKFNISAKLPASQIFAGQVNKKRLIGVFKGITNALLAAEDYMIDSNSILLDFDYIYADVATCNTVLVCVPVQNSSEPIQLGAFFKNVIFKTQFDQAENCDYVAQIISFLNRSDVFSLEEFRQLLEQIGAENVRTSTAQPVCQTAHRAPQPSASHNPVQQAVLQAPKQQPIQQNPPVMTQPPVMPTQTTVMQVPSAPAATAKNVQNEGNNEKRMTMFQLLMHYSKENAAVYKAQKEAAKGETAGKKSGKAKDKKAKPAPDYSVPGAPTNNGFAIPGQATPPMAEASAVPQQPFYQPMQQNPVQQTHQPMQQSPVQQNYQPAPPQPVAAKPAAVQTAPANFGETVVLGSGGFAETTVLSPDQKQVQMNPHLIRSKNNERINITKQIFHIGTESSYADYCISDNSAVSHSHANIVVKNGEYFVVDTNSTNHTFVNGKIIPSSAEIKLSHGTKVTFANDEFEFRLY